MRILAWMRDHLLATALCYLVVVAVTVVSGFGIAVWLVAALAVGGSTGALLDAVLGVLILTLLAGTIIAFVSLVGIGFGLYARVASAVAWADESLVWLTEAVSRCLLQLRSVAARVADPPDSHPGSPGSGGRLDGLKTAYVQGALSEREFERRVDERLDGPLRERDR